jgi:dephospho-CoA kinase
MKILVVTGGIGSGKSEVCRLLGEMGIRAQYDADKRVKDLYDTHPTLLTSIEGSLGISLRNQEGRFVPARLAEVIFSDRNALNLVESLVFPALQEDFKAFSEDNAGEDIVVFESATILQKPQFDGFGDKVLFVDAPEELRLERACARDGSTVEAVKGRMANQKLMNDSAALLGQGRVDALVLNDGSYALLKERLMEIMSELFDSDGDIN